MENPVQSFSIMNFNYTDIFKKYFVHSTSKTHIQFLRYTFVGGIAFLFNLAFLYIFTNYFHIFYVISATLSFTIG
ncbi:MAG: GtrA domain-containing protein, partial [Patescibacteria group bacterium]